MGFSAVVGEVPPVMDASAVPPPATMRAVATPAMRVARLRRVRWTMPVVSKAGESVECAKSFMALISSSSKGVQPEERWSCELIGFLP